MFDALERQYFIQFAQLQLFFIIFLNFFWQALQRVREIDDDFFVFHVNLL